MYPDMKFVIMDTLESSGVYKLSPRTSVYGAILNGKNEGLMMQSPIYSSVNTDTAAATVNAYFAGVRHTF
jgi:hypothetical protein